MIRDILGISPVRSSRGSLRRTDTFFGFWTFVFSVIGAFFFGQQVLYVTILSCVALIPNFTSETPPKVEEDA